MLISFSCNPFKTKEKTFLDYEFGMDYKEYKKHTYDLQKEGIIEFKQIPGSTYGMVDLQTVMYHLKLPHPKGFDLDFYGDVRGSVTYDDKYELMDAITYTFKYSSG